MLNLFAGWLLFAALYVVYVRGYSTPDPSRAVQFAYRKRVGDRFGFVPPSRDIVGLGLWFLTVLGFVAAIGFFLIGDRFIGTSSAVMIGAFLVTLWREDRWIKNQPDYQAEIDASVNAQTGRKARREQEAVEGGDADAPAD